MKGIVFSKQGYFHFLPRLVNFVLIALGIVLIFLGICISKVNLTQRTLSHRVVIPQSNHTRMRQGRIHKLYMYETMQLMMT